MEQGVSSDEDLGLVRAGKERIKRIFAASAGAESDAHSERRQQFFEVLEMLLGKDLGRSHQGGLVPCLDSQKHGCGGDEGFSRSDITLQETVHGPGRCQVLADLRHRA